MTGVFLFRGDRLMSCEVILTINALSVEVKVKETQNKSKQGHEFAIME
jgi:hypothetical protein